MKGWWIIKSFSHKGLTYSQGEPPPRMSKDEALELARAGFICRPGADRPTPVTQIWRDMSIRTPPTEAAHYLETSDEGCICLIRIHRPSIEMLREVTQIALNGRRSLVLIEALKTLSKEPLTEQEMEIERAAGWRR